MCYQIQSSLPSAIHHQISQVYGDNAMSDGMVRKWVRMFNEGRYIYIYITLYIIYTLTLYERNHVQEVGMLWRGVK